VLPTTSPEGAKDSDHESVSFRVPHCAGLARRAQLDELLLSAKETPIVSVEGLSGNGKTFAVSHLLQFHGNALWKGVPLWYTAYPAEPLGGLLNALDIKAASERMGARKVLDLLERRSAVLIIDDYHDVDHASFDILLEVAALYPPPAKIITISQTYIFIEGFPDALSHVKIQGFNEREMRTYLKGKKVKGLPQPLFAKLKTVTDGLPFAISLFASLVREFNRDPEDLLSGTMLQTERLRSWFDEVLQRCSENEASFLYALSLIQGPFNERLGRSIAHLTYPLISNDLEKSAERPAF
jgi:hypothetical protein